MEITAGRGGGIAGSVTTKELGPIDTSALDAEIRSRIEALVKSVDFFQVSTNFPVSAPRSDPESTWIRVVNGNKDRTIGWDDNHEPPSQLEDLVHSLEESGAAWHDVPPPPL